MGSDPFYFVCEDECFSRGRKALAENHSSFKIRTGSSLLMDLLFSQQVTTAQETMMRSVTRNHRGLVERFDFAIPKDESPMPIILLFNVTCRTNPTRTPMMTTGSVLMIILRISSPEVYPIALLTPSSDLSRMI